MPTNTYFATIGADPIRPNLANFICPDLAYSTVDNVMVYAPSGGADLSNYMWNINLYDRSEVKRQLVGVVTNFLISNVNVQYSRMSHPTVDVISLNGGLQHQPLAIQIMYTPIY